MRAIFFLFTLVGLAALPTALHAQQAVQGQGVTDNSMVLYSDTGITASANGTGMLTPVTARAIFIRRDVTNNSGTTPTFDAKLQHSQDNSAWVDLPNSA